jgi:hypothetical protein
MFVNLTPHDINMIGVETITIHSSGLARCEEIRVSADEISGFPTAIITYGDVSGIPDPEVDTFYIVSALCFQATTRKDVVAVTDLVRNDKGQIIGARGFQVKP